ncbi:biotin transporter BioY [Enterococcus sp. BWB1-3]|uniref:biotin transporter BioY n=1 Tax=unclassified Enterococcus TaxID=2608891 RepID=UPI001922D947|nr:MULTISPECIES: biotin transporter BioY [unclassified Enterococcus]MBL1228645.1 biotin transporter BioY [Enterococcus sp. BWB1-3]MCB5952716.1 biotin transporter BioY [Enterococcus sp. BWT-B8]MCB5953632.1 biotin transporter BioY [Enterococcus sp. CWB-B31]
MNSSLRSMILAAEFAAIIAIFSQLTIPTGLIPLTGQTLAVGLAVTVLGRRVGTYAILIYLLLGLIGLPVFAGMKSGVAALLGPTGGYLIGFIFNGLITGTVMERKSFNYTWAVLGNIIGAMVTLIFGTLWLKIYGGTDWLPAFQGGFIPFIIPGIIKAVLAAYLGILIRNRLPAAMLNSEKSVHR